MTKGNHQCPDFSRFLEDILFPSGKVFLMLMSILCSLQKSGRGHNNTKVNSRCEFRIGYLVFYPFQKICPSSLSFSFSGNSLSNSSASASSTKYTFGVAYSPVMPFKYPAISSLQRKNDASAPSGKP